MTAERIEDGRPTLSEAIRYAVRSEILSLHTGLIAEVLDYDAESRTCKVQPIGERRQESGEPFELPPIEGVPTLHMVWGDFEIYAPVKIGQQVMLHFSERSLEQWRLGRTEPPRARDIMRLSDAIAHPGVSNPRAENDDEGDALVIRHSGGGAVVLRADGSLELGESGATEPVVRKSDLQAVVDDVQSKLADLNTALATNNGADVFTWTEAPDPLSPAQGSNKVTSA